MAQIKTTLNKLGFLAVVALIAQGCAPDVSDLENGTAMRDQPQSESTPSETVTPEAIEIDTSAYTAYIPTLTTPTDPPLEFKVEQVGYNSITIKVKTRTRLRVVFAPGIQDKTVKETGYAPPYSKLGVNITVEGLTQATPLLQNGYNSGQAQTSGVLDFSSAVQTKWAKCAVPSSSKAYHKYHCDTDEISITLSKPNYDYWCLANNLCAPVYPSHTVIHDTHPWNGTLLVETDDTAALLK